eukprot:scaffold172105_cov19-Tisochrysis_lutea.AAC.1
MHKPGQGGYVLFPGAGACQFLVLHCTALQRRWSPDQLDALRAAALARLHALAPLCPEVRPFLWLSKVCSVPSSCVCQYQNHIISCSMIAWTYRADVKDRLALLFLHAELLHAFTLLGQYLKPSRKA